MANCELVKKMVYHRKGMAEVTTNQIMSFLKIYCNLIALQYVFEKIPYYNHMKRTFTL